MKLLKLQSVLSIVLLVIGVLSGSLRAAPTTAYEAEMVVTGWLRVNAEPLGMVLGREVEAVETFDSDFEVPAYYVVCLAPSGFVVVSADDLIEPIIGFAVEGVYDPSPDRPLGALVTHDLNGRTSGVRDRFSLLANSPQAAITETQQKWNRLIGLALGPGQGIGPMGEAPIENESLSDVRVAPLVESRWGQTNIWADGRLEACYNYFTPQFLNSRIVFIEDDPNNYPAGCVATAMAQLMRYHQHPLEPVEPEEFTITMFGHKTKRGVFGGDGPNGSYDWDNMLLSPGDDTTDEQRRAIGALCHDAGVAVDMTYTADGSGTTLQDAATALVNTFKYSNAILGESSDNPTARKELLEMINPNLDAGLPVILGILSNPYSYSGHAVVCDGYGYDHSTLYHHLNMGWGGTNDCWYNLPDVNCPQGRAYTVIVQCVYNVFTETAGEIISGRVFDDEGRPVEGAVVTARSENDGLVYAAETNSKGIYVLAWLPSNSTFTVAVEKAGYGFFPNGGTREVATERSSQSSSSTGNVWGIDFRGYNTNEIEEPVGNAKLTASDGRAGDRFGCSVSISGDYAIVGAYGDDGYNPDCGAAYIFKREGASWIEQAKIEAVGEGRFGSSVCISEDFAVVGAGCKQIGCNTGPFSAHVYKRNGMNWTQLAELKAPDVYDRDYFGWSVSISGNYTVVGAPRDDEDTESKPAIDPGSVCVFEHRDTSWVFSTKLRASDAIRYDEFGSLVSISGEYLIAAQRANPPSSKAYGAVYTFKRGDAGWVEQAKINPPLGQYVDLFGNSIAVSESCAIVGAPAGDGNKAASGLVYLYDNSGTSWAGQPTLTGRDSDSFDLFGAAVAISGDYIIVGAPDDDDDFMGRDSGSVYVFKRDGAGWAQQAKLTAFDGAVGDRFGSQVAIDGEYVIVGAEDDDDKGSGSGSVYVFRRIGSTWMP